MAGQWQRDKLCLVLLFLYHIISVHYYVPQPSDLINPVLFLWHQREQHTLLREMRHCGCKSEDWNHQEHAASIISAGDGLSSQLLLLQ